MSFDEAWAAQAVIDLRATGVEFAPGFDDAAVANAAAVFGVELPIELDFFLRAGVPTSPRWARWIDGPDVVLADGKDWIDSRFSFEIRECGYWHQLFGDRPRDDDAAVELALAFIAVAPPLIKLHGHRFLATRPADGPRAVLSLWRPLDTIFYGNDLADYLANEFVIPRPPWVAPEPPPVPVWGSLLGLTD